MKTEQKTVSASEFQIGKIYRLHDSQKEKFSNLMNAKFWKDSNCMTGKVWIKTAFHYEQLKPSGHIKFVEIKENENKTN